MKSLYLIFLLYFFYSCEYISMNVTPFTNGKKIVFEGDFLLKQIVTGDFDGDGVPDEMKEVLISSINDESIDVLPKLDYDSLVMWISKKEPVLYLKSDNELIPDLHLTSQPSYGVLWIKNEGDLNRNGRDEISVVIDWADWSSLNHCMVYSLGNNGWEKWIAFSIREWQIENNADFKGFIQTNDTGEKEILTFDEEGIETAQKLQDFIDSQ